MSFGVCAAHRCGKSTLAKRLSEDMGFHFFEASFGAIAKDLGWASAVDKMTLTERMAMQEAVLDEYVRRLYLAPRPFITDRTPLDMIGYTLGEVTMNGAMDEVLSLRINAYVTRCVHVARSQFDAMILLRPLPFYEVEVGKPPLNIAYQTAVQFIIEGAFERVNDQVEGLVITADDFEQRVEAATDFLSKRCDILEVARAQACLN